MVLSFEEIEGIWKVEDEETLSQLMRSLLDQLSAKDESGKREFYLYLDKYSYASFFKCMEKTFEKSSITVLTMALLSVFLDLCNGPSTFSLGSEMARYFQKNHIKYAYRCITSGNPEENQVALALLRSCSLFGTRDLVRYFDFGVKNIQKLAHNRKQKIKALRSPRSSFIDFVLQFLSTAESAQFIAKLKDFSVHLFKGMKEDELDTITYIVDRITKEFVLNDDISKTTKLLVFNPYALETMSLNYKREEPIVSKVHSLLTLLCSDKKHGIIFKDDGWYAKSISNKLMFKFLSKLSIHDHVKSWELVETILKNCQELIPDYWKSCGLVLEPHADSIKWMVSTGFVCNVLKHDLPKLKMKRSDEETVELPDSALRFLMPSIVQKSFLNKGLQSSDMEVRRQTLGLLFALLNRYKKFKSFKIGYKELVPIQAEFKKNLPDIQLFIALNSQETDESGKALLLYTFSLLQSLFPEMLADSRFDATKLVPKDLVEAGDMVQIASISLLVALNDCNWNAVEQVVRLWKTSETPKIRLLSYQFLFMFFCTHLSTLESYLLLVVLDIMNYDQSLYSWLLGVMKKPSFTLNVIDQSVKNVLLSKEKNCTVLKVVNLYVKLLYQFSEDGSYLTEQVHKSLGTFISNFEFNDQVVTLKDFVGLLFKSTSSANFKRIKFEGEMRQVKNDLNSPCDVTFSPVESVILFDADLDVELPPIVKFMKGSPITEQIPIDISFMMALINYSISNPVDKRKNARNEENRTLSILTLLRKHFKRTDLELQVLSRIEIDDQVVEYLLEFYPQHEIVLREKSNFMNSKYKEALVKVLTPDDVLPLLEGNVGSDKVAAIDFLFKIKPIERSIYNVRCIELDLETFKQMNGQLALKVLTHMAASVNQIASVGVAFKVNFDIAELDMTDEMLIVSSQLDQAVCKRAFDKGLDIIKHFRNDNIDINILKSGISFGHEFKGLNIQLLQQLLPGELMELKCKLDENTLYALGTILIGKKEYYASYIHLCEQNGYNPFKYKKLRNRDCRSMEEIEKAVIEDPNWITLLALYKRMKKNHEFKYDANSLYRVICGACSFGLNEFDTLAIKTLRLLESIESRGNFRIQYLGRLGYGPNTELLANLDGSRVFDTVVGNEGGYNFTYLLSWILNYFKSAEVDIPLFIEKNLLGIALKALSLNRHHRAGCYILFKFDEWVSKVDFREKVQVQVVLEALKSSKQQRLSFLTCLFFYYAFTLKSEHFMYPKIHRFILQKPYVDCNDIPLFFHMMYSTGNHHQERVWMLRFLANSIKDQGTFHIFQKRHVFDLLMSFMSSGRFDDTMIKICFDIWKNALKMSETCRTLVQQKNLIPWLVRLFHTLDFKAQCKDLMRLILDKVDPDLQLEFAVREMQCFHYKYSHLSTLFYKDPQFMEFGIVSGDEDEEVVEYLVRNGYKYKFKTLPQWIHIE